VKHFHLSANLTRKVIKAWGIEKIAGLAWFAGLAGFVNLRFAILIFLIYPDIFSKMRS